MARSRNIKPSLFKNELLGQEDPFLTILFAGLWCLADRDGLLEDRPLRIKAEIFPYRDGINVNSLLAKLHDLGFIRRYSVDNFNVIEILKFSEHQNPHHTEKPSDLPKFQQNQKDVQTPLNNGAETVNILLIPDSFKRIPDSCSSPAAKKKATQIDPDYKFNDQHRSLARSLGVSADVELGAFTDYHKSKGSVFKDWDAAFRTWLRNAAKFNAGKSPPQPQQTTAAHRPYTEPIRDKEQEKLDAKKAMQRLEQLARLKNGQQANDRAKP